MIHVGCCIARPGQARPGGVGQAKCQATDPDAHTATEAEIETEAAPEPGQAGHEPRCQVGNTCNALRENLKVLRKVN